MFHLELFSSSIASGANTFAQVSYITADAVLPAIASGVQVSPELPYLMGYGGLSANLVHIRAQTPSMLPFPYISSSPNNRGTAFESPPRWWDFSQAPIPLKVTDEFDIFATQNAGAGQTVTVGVLFCDGKPSPLPSGLNPMALTSDPRTPGRLFTVHSSTATTVTASAFSTVQLAFDQALPAGMYACVGARAFSLTGQFFRLLPATGPKWRPGGVCVQAYDQLDPDGQRIASPYDTVLNYWGPWLYFYQNVPPKVEFWCTAGDTAQEVWLDLVYLGPQTSMGVS